MKRKWTFLVAVVVLFALLFAGCQRQRQTSAEEESPSPSAGGDIGSTDTLQPSEPPSESEDPKNGQSGELIPFTQEQGTDMLFGYMDSDRNVVIEPMFSRAEPFYDCGLAIVVNTDGKSGLIDKTGQYVAAPKADYLYYYEGIFVGFAQDESVTCL